MVDAPRRVESVSGLVFLFGSMYFVQGIAEPTSGLIAQPVRSLLKNWEYSPTEIAAFSAVVSLPWSFKPIYGLLTDFVPLFGTRRRSYLLGATGMSALSLLVLYLVPLPPGSYGLVLALLVLPTVGVAFADVVVDALMVQWGQPRGMTGTLQSAQWTAMYAGSVLAGLAGGYLSEHGREPVGFLICAVALSGATLLTWSRVREERATKRPARFRVAVRELIRAARSPLVLVAAAFLFLWSFNPFGMSVAYLYLTQELGIGEQFYGFTLSLLSAGAIVGSLSYGAYCRRVSLRALVHLAIVAGVLCTLSYAFVTGPISAAVVSAVAGFTYITGTMVQLDLAARVCPIRSAGTTFALLMAVSNLSLSLAGALGGWFYDDWTQRWSAPTAFKALVVTGAVFTSGCWILAPMIFRTVDSAEVRPSEGG
ncbi:MAG: MFS transporter [Planctomycetes bacterium]|nr:MFS transporter [Planctomycetota bacterium]